MDCNYGELWIETLKNNPDSTVSIQVSTKKE